jgi:hypothetical protein
MGSKSRKLITNRDGDVIDGYDLFEGGETELYPVYYSSEPMRVCFKTESGDVFIEGPYGQNLTNSAPIDDNGKRQIIGWSTDSKAKYWEDIEFPAYRGEYYCKMYISKEGATYYPIYSEYKDVSIVWKEYSETKRIFAKCTDEYSYIYLSELNSFENTQEGRVYAAAFKGTDGKLYGFGKISYADAVSAYTIIKKYTGPTNLTVRLIDSKKGTETKFKLNLYDSKVYLNIPNEDPNFLGWFRNPDSLDAGEIEYIRFESDGSYAFVKYKNEERERYQSIGYESSSLELYAVYKEESEGAET